MPNHLKYPPDADLRRLLRFAPDEGAIWLGERRMVLLHTASLGALRKDLINSIGLEQARRIFTRMGYASGLNDAEFARKTRPGDDPAAAFLVGPQLHMLEGAARVTPLKMTFDREAGRFEGEFRWDHSWEAHAHRHTFGPADDPSCWMLTGYACGYTSAFMGRLILFKEVACTACGDDHCRIVGRPIEDWPDGEAHRVYFESDSLVEKIEALSLQVEALRSTLAPTGPCGSMVGQSPAFRRAFELLGKAAATQVTVLLTGETGVGKERFARTLHELSVRRDGPFVAVNCAALPAELIEAELFGVEKGAYTGAHAARTGRFERADGGTLFLDEIGDLPVPLQAKLLRALQEGEIERLGSETTRKVNVRLVAATNVDLDAAVKAGRFRRDLLYRLNIYPIRIPPLRERGADIELLGADAARALHGAARQAAAGFQRTGVAGAGPPRLAGQCAGAGEPGRARRDPGGAGRGDRGGGSVLAEPWPWRRLGRPHRARSAWPARRAAARSGRRPVCADARQRVAAGGAGTPAARLRRRPRKRQPLRGGPPPGHHAPAARLPAAPWPDAV